LAKNDLHFKASYGNSTLCNNVDLLLQHLAKVVTAPGQKWSPKVGKQTSKETYANQKRPTQHTYRLFGLVLGVPGQMRFITLGERPSKETNLKQKRSTKDAYWRLRDLQKKHTGVQIYKRYILA